MFMPNLADKGGLPSTMIANNHVVVTVTAFWLEDRFNLLGDFVTFDQTSSYCRHRSLIEGTADVLLPNSV
jgi:hypothetical protein